MKALGQSDLRDKLSEAIRYALGTGVLDGFTIGAESCQQQNDLIHRIAVVSWPTSIAASSADAP